MHKIEELEKWMQRLRRYNKNSILIESTDDSKVGEIVRDYRLYTDKYCYNIRAKDKQSEDGYLGCTVSTRKPRAGEDYNRGNDLADGKFTQETWYNIMCDIIAYELVEISPPESDNIMEEKKYAFVK